MDSCRICGKWGGEDETDEVEEDDDEEEEDEEEEDDEDDRWVDENDDDDEQVEFCIKGSFGTGGGVGTIFISFSVSIFLSDGTVS